jgi:hypothetical protein
VARQIDGYSIYTARLRPIGGGHADAVPGDGSAAERRSPRPPGQ